MQTVTRHALGSLGKVLDPEGPYIDEAVFSKAEMAALTKAADILENLRAKWGGQDGEFEHPYDTEVALAMYTMRELVEAGRLEL